MFLLSTGHAPTPFQCRTIDPPGAFASLNGSPVDPHRLDHVRRTTRSFTAAVSPSSRISPSLVPGRNLAFQLLEHVAKFPHLALHDRREDHLRLLRRSRESVPRALASLRMGAPVFGSCCCPRSRRAAKIIVNLVCSDRRAWAASGRACSMRWQREPFDKVDIRLFASGRELPGVSRKAFT